MTKPVIGKPYTSTAKSLELGARGFESPVKESRLVSFRLVCDNTNRVHRGGSWSRTADDARAANRFGDNPGSRIANRGFRLARDTEQG